MSFGMRALLLQRNGTVESDRAIATVRALGEVLGL
jgi:hypothetical protein